MASDHRKDSVTKTREAETIMKASSACQNNNDGFASFLELHERLEASECTLTCHVELSSNFNAMEKRIGIVV